MTRILGFTDLRRRELETPLSAAGYEGDLIAVDPDGSLWDRTTTQLVEGYRAGRGDPPELVLAYNGSGVLGILAVLFGWWFAVPVVVRVNGDVFRQHRERVHEHWSRREYAAAAAYALQAALTRLTFARADGFIVVSEELREVVHDRTGAPRSRIAVVHNPVPLVDPEGDGGTAVAPADGTARTLLTVTNLNFRGKLAGVETVIDEIWPTLPDDVEYIIAGDGIYGGELEAYVESTVTDPATRERIRTPGYVDAVDALYARADAFVYVSDIDGYPNVVLEAQAAGLPVIANKAHGMVEQIDHGRTGLLVDPARRGAVRNAVLSTLSDGAMGRRLGAAARRQVRRHNDPERIGDAMHRAIDGILADVDGRAGTAAAGS